MNITVITGASSGLGMEFAMQLDENFFRSEKITMDEIWLIARRNEKLQELSGQLLHKVRIFAMDVTDDAAMASFADTLAKLRPCIRMLVNCAGLGLLGDFARLPAKEQLQMLHVNCTALTKMTHMCIPYMKRNSRIIQLASSAAFLPQPGFAVYAATKSYVLSFARATGAELKKRGIYVTAVCPGPVQTEFFENAEKYQGRLSVKNLTIVAVHGVVADAIKASMRKKPIAVYSPPIKAFAVLAKLLPHALPLWFMDCLEHRKLRPL